VGIAQLRMITMKAAVHSDMIEWHVDDTAENGARMILNSMFGVVQYSMRIDRLPKDHLEMMRHWIQFSREHESALLHGEFRAHYPEMKFPILEAWDAKERIVGVYARDLVVDVGTVDRTTYVLNVTDVKKLTIRCAGKVPRAVVFDTFGKKVGEVELAVGMNEVAVPSAGFIKCAR
jgi:alpha-galactosidase